MDDNDVDTVMLVCDNEEESRTLLGKLVAQGIRVIGPVTNVAQAKTLVAQTFADIAVFARPSAGPLGRDLARDLMKTWGVPSLILEDGAESQGEWSPRPAQAEHLRRLLAPDATAA